MTAPIYLSSENHHIDVAIPNDKHTNAILKAHIPVNITDWKPKFKYKSIKAIGIHILTEHACTSTQSHMQRYTNISI